jgi:F-type H+-transporting ATPase subunit gamma
MSLEIREVKRRIRSTRQIRQVTGAMQRVSAARLLNDRRVMESSRRYTGRLTDVLREICAAADGIDHPFLTPPRQEGPIALIVFGSDRGLCGGYNARLMDAVETFLRSRAPRPVQLLVMGRVVSRRARRRRMNVQQTLPQPRRPDRADTLDRLLETVTDGFLNGTWNEVHVLYSRFVSVLVHEPVTERILPAPFRSGKAGRMRAAVFEPEPRVMLARRLPEFVRQAIDHAFLNGLASEDAARETAMSRASDNADEMLGGLMQSFRRLRQEHITTEMIELAGGRLL